MQEPDHKKQKLLGGAPTACFAIFGGARAAAGSSDLAKNGISGGKIVPTQSTPGAPPTALNTAKPEAKPKPEPKKGRTKAFLFEFFPGGK